MIIVETFGRWRQPRAPPHATAPTGKPRFVTRRRLRFVTPQHHRCSECPRVRPAFGCGEAAVSQSQQVPDPSSAGRRFPRTEPPPTARPEPAAQPPQPRKTRNPHRPSPQPRGSCLGGFPTPDRIRKPSPPQSPDRRVGNPESGHALTQNERLRTVTPLQLTFHNRA